MDRQKAKDFARHLWGFFTVATWIVGAPMVCKLGYIGASNGVSEARALVLGTTTPTPSPTPTPKEVVEPKLPVQTKEMLAVYSEKEYDEMIAIYNEYKALQKTKGAKRNG